ncbi:hypothetical protein DPEC_G00054890 [Dallia pectoralis]|uniref:Uncharacterized protein n=1 Tax=Dallia pectoralis TaxID=75939 RepID=A0ACC2H626_DALPE|nr:hypothetical protein DPEC_G00054890 [Dallia pectoralis]
MKMQMVLALVIFTIAIITTHSVPIETMGELNVQSFLSEGPQYVRTGLVRRRRGTEQSQRTPSRFCSGCYSVIGDPTTI